MLTIGLGIKTADSIRKVKLLAKNLKKDMLKRRISFQRKVKMSRRPPMSKYSNFIIVKSSNKIWV